VVETGSGSCPLATSCIISTGHSDSATILPVVAFKLSF
jgi:hypothetical protein